MLALALLGPACAEVPAGDAVPQGDAMPQGVEVRVAPLAPLVAPQGPVVFSAMVTGTANPAVTWSVSEPGGGTVDSTGQYTAPATAGTYHVVVQSVVDPTVSAVATVTVAGPASSEFRVGGTVSGLTGSGLVLSMAGQADLSVTAGATSFTFDGPIASGNAYAVAVKAQPTSQTCTVANGTGTVGSQDVTNVAVTCASAPVAPPPGPAPVTYRVGGTVSGLTGAGLVLSSSGQSDLAVAAGATSFTFGSPAASGSAYAVRVKTQPTSQTCTVANGTGTVGSQDVTNITVTCPAAPVGTIPTLLEQLAADMTGSNEAYPHGVPTSWDWAKGPVLNRGTNPVYNGITATAATTWGLVYEAAQGNPATNTRVNIRNVRLLFKSKSTGQWSVLQSTSTPNGNNYHEDFSGTVSPPDVRTEPDNTISVKVGGGYMFHFFPSRRGTFDPADIGGWIAILEARLILDNPAGPDDRSIAQLLAAAGADYWPTATTNWPSSGAPSIADGKLKYVKTYWRWYAITSLSAAEMAANPPPLQETGVSQ